MIKVSVIVPVYNTEKYLEKCINSLINQTLREIEIIIINDGSTDNSDYIISKYLKDNRIKYFKRDNYGIGNTRNFGIEKSIGETICFVDSDDYVDTTYLEKMYLKLKQDGLDMVICDYYEDKKNILKKYKLNNFSNTTLLNNPKLLIDVNLGPCNKLFKKNLFDNNKFPTDIKYEDMALICIILNESKLIGKINEYLCYFNVHTNSETTTMDIKVFDIFKSMDIILKYFKNSDKKVLEYVNYLVISKINLYMIQQRKQKNKKLRNKFINEGFDYLNKNIKNYKNNLYFRERNKLKLIIEKHKLIMKLYCCFYCLFRR